MPSPEPLIRNISDTARWVAHYRAAEHDRADRVFTDPFARRLAGERGAQIAASAKELHNGWPIIARTWSIDKMVLEHVAQGFDTVINLAAGLDTRPYRLELPAALKWIEIDLPGILDFKKEQLRDDKPRCQLEQVALDLSNRPARQELLHQVGRQSVRTLVITEGLLIYLTEQQVDELATDLLAQSSFQHWATDLASPALIKMLNKKMGPQLAEANAPFQFGPKDGIGFFEKRGWKQLEVHSQLGTAAKLNRLPWFLRLMSFMFGGKEPSPDKPWSAVCLFCRE